MSMFFLGLLHHLSLCWFFFSFPFDIPTCYWWLELNAKVKILIKHYLHYTLLHMISLRVYTLHRYIQLIILYLKKEKGQAFLLHYFVCHDYSDAHESICKHIGVSYVTSLPLFLSIGTSSVLISKEMCGFSLSYF